MLHTAVPAPRQAAWRVEAQDALEGCVVEWVYADGRCIVSAGPRLYLVRGNEPPTLLGHVPVPLPVRAAAAMRPVQRALRALFSNVVPLSGRTAFASYGARVYALRDGIARPLSGLLRPTRIMRGGCALAADGVLYFGEYREPKRPAPSHVYAWDAKEARARVVYTFAPHSIGHVQGLHINPSDGALWCLTGGKRGQCRILRTEDGFRSVEVLGAGDETWNAMTLRFVGSYAYYATCADHLENRIMRLDLHSGRRELVGPVNGPVNASAAVGSDVFFGVMVTPAKRHPDRHAALWHVDAQGRLRRLMRFDKGRMPTSIAPGGLLFSCGHHDSGFYCAALGLQGVDGKVFYVRR